MSPDYLDKLRTQLPNLYFDTTKDITSDQWPLCNEYLDFYQLPESPQVRHFLGKTSVHNYQLCTHYWLPENPIATVCISHGYFDHIALYGHLISYLLGKNYAVVGFDLPGHGLSSGEKATIKSFNLYEQIFTSVLEKIGQLPAPIHAVGQSTGGAVLLNYLLTRAKASEAVLIDKVILLAPLIQPAKWQTGQLMYALMRHFKTKIPRAFLVNSADKKFIDFIQNKDPLQAHDLSLQWVGAMKQWIHDFKHLPESLYPITVIQGDQDNTVNWQFNCRAIKAKFPNAQEIQIPNANHHLVNESPSIRRQVFEALGL